VITRFRGFVDTHPIWFTAILAVALAAFLLARHSLFGGQVTYATAIPGEIGLLAITFVIVGLLGWWRRTGVAGPVRVGWTLAALAGALVYYLTLDVSAFFVFRLVPAGFLLAALVGAAEELLTRGIVLEALRPLGVLAAACGSALFFGLLHLSNLVLAPSPSVVAQAAYAILLGLFLAAARLRVQSIWPLAVTHAGIDLPGLATGHFLPPALPNPWLSLIPVAIALPWGAAGIGMLLWDELRRR
jgi:membrane protease YdiL (CAAX protease family)